MSRDFFSHKANTYEADGNRVTNVANIANAIVGQVALDPKMHLMDFGSGTGLLLERIAPFVGRITAIDVSSSMNEQLASKIESLACEVEILEIDLESTTITQKFDGIISSMTMHHVRDTAAMFVKFHSLLKEGGFIAISDIDSEDGSFHTDDTGVHHFGFDRESIAQAAQKAGFRAIEIIDASIVKKPHGNYPVFLLTGMK